MRTSGPIYKPYDAHDIINRNVTQGTVKSNKKLEYYNTPVAFDIETSSFYDNEEKRACMYLWQLCIYEDVIQGRTWEEFLYVINTIVDVLDLNEHRRLVIYSHFLSYEFQWIRKYFKWYRIFANKSRQPIYAITENGIEFRDSYILTALSLRKVGENLVKYKVAKMSGDLDYAKVRHSKTPLLDKELHYGENDVRVVAACIQEKIESDGDITKIPLTNTGYVRNYCRKMCLTGEHKKDKSQQKYTRYHDMIQELTLEVDEYELLRRAFMGGFTHASRMHVNRLLRNVGSYDFTSSYPAVMVLENRFPMSKGRKVSPETIEEFREYLENYCCIFDISISNINSIVEYEFYLSESKCRHSKGLNVFNGRVTDAEYIETTFTELDFEIFETLYKYDSFSIGDMYIYEPGYLPKNLVDAILKLYADKTELKGVAEKIEEYMKSKGMINAVYGMSVMDPVREEQEYIDEWSKPKRGDTKKYIEKYNTDPKRFLFYPWGLYVTALARYNLFTGIVNWKTDYAYADTDSGKVLNYKSHKNYFDKYNSIIEQKIKRASRHFGFDEKRYKPKTIKEVEKPIGAWDFEGEYTYFKALGAKRYLTYSKESKIFSLTFAGVNKKTGAEYLLDKNKIPWFYDDEKEIIIVLDDSNILKAFESFSTVEYSDTLGEVYKTLKFPVKYAGRQASVYIDNETEGVVTDYLGNTAEYHELSSINLTSTLYETSGDTSLHEYMVDVTKLVMHLCFGYSDSLDNFYSTLEQIGDYDYDSNTEW